jgi:hypothetical protein
MYELYTSLGGAGGEAASKSDRFVCSFDCWLDGSLVTGHHVTDQALFGWFGHALATYPIHLSIQIPDSNGQLEKWAAKGGWVLGGSLHAMNHTCSYMSSILVQLY